MKKPTDKKALVLNKETVKVLRPDKLAFIAGGRYGSDIGCISHAVVCTST